jgi:hypothetical protein
MKTFLLLVKRNMKLFFNDKGMFLTSLITPMILLVLYITFLGNVYRDSLMISMGENIKVSEASNFGGFDLLVGMDIIKRGVFLIDGTDGELKVLFQFPADSSI